MNTPYLAAWIVVIVAGLATVLGVYGLTRRMRSRYLKSLLRTLSVVVLMLPAPVPGFEGKYSPAFVVALFEGLFQHEGKPAQALKLLAAGVLVVLVLVSAWYALTRRRETSGST